MKTLIKSGLFILILLSSINISAFPVFSKENTNAKDIDRTELLDKEGEKDEFPGRRQGGGTH